MSLPLVIDAAAGGHRSARGGSGQLGARGARGARSVLGACGIRGACSVSGARSAPLCWRAVGCQAGWQNGVDKNACFWVL